MADGLVSIQDRKPEPEPESAALAGRRPRRALRHKANTISKPVRAEQPTQVGPAKSLRGGSNLSVGFLSGFLALVRIVESFKVG